MATEHIVQLLIQERDKLSRAIEALQGSAPAKRRGRPPKKPVASAVTLPSVVSTEMPEAAEAERPKKRKGFSAATKRKMALAQKKRWAAKKAAQ
jgi:hypothetical protein